MPADREFLLKALQAWMDAKYKIAAAAVLGNGALLATAFAVFKEKGADALTAYTVQWASCGLGFAIVGYALVWGYWDGRLVKLVQNALGADSNIETEFRALGWVNSIFAVLMFGSSVCFLTCVVYFIGWSDALLDISRR